MNRIILATYMSQKNGNQRLHYKVQTFRYRNIKQLTLVNIAREGAKTVWRTGPLESSEQAADLSLNISNTSPDATTYVNEDIEAGWAHPRDAGVECTVTVSEVAISAA